MTIDFKQLEKHDDNIDNYHLNRVAFLILNGEVKLLKNSKMSHYEWAQSIGIDETKFRTLTRGYFFNNYMVFYKNNFEYDKGVIADAKIFAPKICKMLKIDDCDVYCGVEIGIGVIWPPKHFVGRASTFKTMC